MTEKKTPHPALVITTLSVALIATSAVLTMLSFIQFEIVQ